MANPEKQNGLARWVMSRNKEVLAVAVLVDETCVTFDREDGELAQGIKTRAGLLVSDLGTQFPKYSIEEFGNASLVLDGQRCVVVWRPDVVLAMAIPSGSPITKSIQRIARRSMTRFFGDRPARPRVAPVPAALRSGPPLAAQPAADG